MPKSYRKPLKKTCFISGVIEKNAESLRQVHLILGNNLSNKD